MLLRCSCICFTPSSPLASRPTCGFVSLIPQTWPSAQSSRLNPIHRPIRTLPSPPPPTRLSPNRHRPMAHHIPYRRDHSSYDHQYRLQVLHHPSQPSTWRRSPWCTSSFRKQRVYRSRLSICCSRRWKTAASLVSCALCGGVPTRTLCLLSVFSWIRTRMLSLMVEILPSGFRKFNKMSCERSTQCSHLAGDGKRRVKNFVVCPRGRKNCG